uniref:Uncharacterized protein LOC105074883 n=1 Tax=Camelus bactrianus TaxID=9837 RepID=A0A9W3GFV1_CAMBA|nr:uncharacterized protein LOC105074883 [Camelus bactrianus]
MVSRAGFLAGWQHGGGGLAGTLSSHARHPRRIPGGWRGLACGRAARAECARGIGGRQPLGRDAGSQGRAGRRGADSEPPRKKPAGRPASPGEAEAAAVQKRAEGRAKVPRKFRDSFKRFFFSPTGALKIIRLALLIGALVYFIIAEAQEYFIAITVLETCIVVCFILIYMLTLHHLMTFLHWPLLSAEHQEADQAHHEPLLSDTRKTLLVKQSYNHGEVSEGKLKISVHGNFQEGKDLINSFITAVFLLILAALAIQEKERRHLFYIGGSLCLTAAIVCLVDGTVVTKRMRNNVKKALGIESETEVTPIPAQETAPAPVKAPTRVPQKGTPKAPTKTEMKHPPLSSRLWFQPTRPEDGSSG